MPARFDQAHQAITDQEKCTDLRDPSGHQVVCHPTICVCRAEFSNSSSVRRMKMILETERLRLREFTLDDGELMLEILNEPGFVRFVADRGVRTPQEAAEYLAEKILPSYDGYGFGFYVVERKEDGRPIGMCGLIKREALDDVDVGFSIFERFWGRGYATEAGRAVMQYGLTKLGLPRIVAITAPDNVRSAAVLEKLGLKFEKMIQIPGYGFESRLFS